MVENGLNMIRMTNLFRKQICFWTDPRCWFSLLRQMLAVKISFFSRVRLWLTYQNSN